MIKSVKILSFLISILAATVAFIGIVNQSIYQPRLNSISSSELLGQDSTSLIIGIIFFICLLIEKNSFFLKTVNLGILSYFIYIYGYFCFSLVASNLFILHMAIFGLSIFMFIYRLMPLMREHRSVDTKKSYPRKTISVFFIIAVLIMLVKEIPYLIDTTIIQNKSMALFDAYCVLDLSFVFPAMIIIAVMNLLKKPYSVIFTGILLIKLTTLMPALFFNDVFHYFMNGFFIDFSFLIITAGFTLISLTLLFLYKRGIRV